MNHRPDDNFPIIQIVFSCHCRAPVSSRLASPVTRFLNAFSRTSKWPLPEFPQRDEADDITIYIFLSSPFSRQLFIQHLQFPSFSSMGRPKHVRIMAGALEGDLFVGPKAEDHRGLLSIRYPMEHGIVTDWNDMERIWTHIYSKVR